MRQSPFLKASRSSKYACACVLFSSYTSSNLHATEIETSGAVTVTHLTSNEDAVASETLGIFDLDIEGQLSHGRFHFYIEGTTTSKAGKVTDAYGLSYADAGGGGR